MTARKPDMTYVGKVIADEIERRYGSPYRLVAAVPNAPGASTIYHVQNASKGYDAQHKVVRRLETALGWPSGTVAALAVQDFAELGRLGVSSDLLHNAHRIAGTKPVKGDRRRAI